MKSAGILSLQTELAVQFSVWHLFSLENSIRDPNTIYKALMLVLYPCVFLFFLGGRRHLLLPEVVQDWPIGQSEPII